LSSLRISARKIVCLQQMVPRLPSLLDDLYIIQREEAANGVNHLFCVSFHPTLSVRREDS
jgi:hypothetical protein